MRKLLSVLIITVTVASGCSVKNVRQTTQYPTYIRETKTIAVMPLDFYIYQITAGKIIELMDSWTDKSKEMVTLALEENLSDRYGYNIKFIDEDWIQENHKALWKDYSALHSTVAKSLMMHAMDGGAHRFPTKKDRFDYTLGAGISELARAVEADSLIFIHGKEYYSTKGKIASEIFTFAVAAALFGAVAIPMLERDTFYFSVINGQTGQIEWMKSVSGGIFTRSFDDQEGVSKVIESVTKDMFP